jgi:uncharacterized damage-inducible protein DinB
MTAKTTEKQAFSAMLIGRWEEAGRKLAELAEAFPKEKYESGPVAGVRTFGDVVRHVAFWNQFVAESARGSQPDGTANELAQADYPDKAQIVEALKQSTADAAAALRGHPGDLETQTAEMLVSFIEHASEHYGQLVVYTRLHGLVPPAARA